ncbi:hypothetical protein [Xenorhabdus ishibashii]|uniref:Uncharacterized protein n=1 Tax=Xenorhabdus ishibashii TaxID=1034471 RepID=A0A2D0KK02_9GAMM|nr:hypothetical protein [Xenorhabdus ishibashii]PHM63726.1 hypothetical protein Xish_02996 [Xenorhabdus ishibashii]
MGCIYILNMTYEYKLNPPSYPQASGGVIDIDAQKAEGARYITMLIPGYGDEKSGDRIVGYFTDSKGNTIPSFPYSVNINIIPSNFFEVVFSIDDFSTNGEYTGHYTVTKLSGNTAQSKIAAVNIETVLSSLPDYFPAVPEATDNHGTLLTKSDYYRLDNLKVIVPIYTGMALGQTVQVLWQGRNNIPPYSTPSQEINEIMPMIFHIPRMEFINSIGSTAKIRFKVGGLNQNASVYSGTLSLDIAGQKLNLPPPRLFYRGDGTVHVIIEYPNMTSDQSVEIRAVGKTMIQTPYKPVDDVQQMGARLSTDWVEENRGQIVLVDYAVGSMHPGVEYDFSEVLRQVL